MRHLFFILPVLFLLMGCASTQTALKGQEPLQEQMRAAQKVVGALSPTGSAVVEKYSPLTGKHYSGALEFEPGTGVKLIPVED